MTLTRLMWIFGALFVVFGLIMAVADGNATRHIWGGLSVASLGCFALAMVFDGVLKGEIRVQFDVINRATRPRLFWAAVALISAAGIVVMVSAVWILFFKAR